MHAILVFVAIIALPSSLFLLAFVIGCFERLVIRSFETAPLDSLPPYMNAIVQSAMQHGFIYRTTGIHTKYKAALPGVLMLSPDCRTLMVCSDGTILRLPSKKTLLYSWFKDDSVLVTVDEAGVADLDRKTTRQIVMKADFDQLLQVHEAALDRRKNAIEFASDTDWSTLDAITRTRVDRIVADGLARYVGSEKDFYTYRPWGSFRATIVHGFLQVLKPKNYVRNLQTRPGG